jgi:hypothetical protein
MCKGDDLATFIVPKVKKIRRLNLWTPKGQLRPVVGRLYLYFMRMLYVLFRQKL